MKTVDEYIQEACKKLGPGSTPTQVQTLLLAHMLQLQDLAQIKRRRRTTETVPTRNIEERAGRG
jgi:hypothetical protein